MPGARKPRDFKAEQAARDARARKLGFKNDYDRRVRGGKTATPSSKRPRGEQLARARGHRSAADLRSALRSGSLVMVENYVRNRKTGRITSLDIRVVDERGRERTFTLRGRQITKEHLRRLARTVEQRDAIFSPFPYMDLRVAAA